MTINGIKNRLPKDLRQFNIELRTECIGNIRGSQTYFAYELRWKGKVIFSGNDYGASPMHMPKRGWNETLPVRALAGLLHFLTLRKGDTDEEYFKDYGPDQWEFVNSDDADTIRLWIYDLENPPERG